MTVSLAFRLSDYLGRNNCDLLHRSAARYLAWRMALVDTRQPPHYILVDRTANPVYDRRHSHYDHSQRNSILFHGVLDLEPTTKRTA